MNWLRPLPLAALLAPLVGVIAPKGLAPLLFLLGAWGWLAGWRMAVAAARQAPRGALLIALAVLVLDLWALVSIAWTPAPATALLSWVNVTAVALALPPLLLAPADATARRAVVIGVVLALLATFGLLAGDYAVLRWAAQAQGKAFDDTQTNRRLVALLLLCWPAALVLLQRRKWWLALPLLAAAMAAVLAGVSNSAQLAVAVALLAALAAFALPRAVPAALAVLIALGVLGAPVAVPALLSPERFEARLETRFYSGLHRLYIWQFASRRIADRPLAGWGHDASPLLPGGDETLPGGGHRMNMHPHNGSLQVWVELGGVGALAWAALLAGIAWSIRRLPGRAAPALATGQLVAALVVVHLSFGLWQTAWLAALGLAAALMLAATRRPRAG